MFILEIFAPLLSIIICVAYYTLAERKIIAYIQRRKGPSNSIIFGVLQPYNLLYISLKITFISKYSILCLV